MTSRVTKILAAVFTTGLLVAIGQDYVRRGVKWVEGQLLPAPSTLTRCIEDILAAEPRSTSQPMTVVLTRLRFDTDGYQTSVIEKSLREIFAAPDLVRQINVPCVILSDRGDQAAAAAAAQALAAEIAGRAGADVVIWGEVRARDRELDLRLTHSAGQDTGIYQVEGVTLSQDFDTALGALVAARALSLAVLPEAEQARYIAPVFEEAARIIGPLVADPPRGMSAAQRSDLFGAYARAQLYVAIQTGDPVPLQAAIDAFRRALEEMETVDNDRVVAGLRSNLGLALRFEGLRTGDPVLLEQAVTLLTQSLGSTSREVDPLDWARTRAVLAEVQGALAEVRRDPEMLRRAILGYRAALAFQKLHAGPQVWATTLANLGRLQIALVLQTENPAAADAAIATYHEVIRHLPRAFAPLDWAVAQNNLGLALVLAGGFTRDTDAYRGALDHFGAAQQEWTRDRMPVEWARAEQNRGWALLLIGEAERDAGAIRAAVVALHAALDVATPEVAQLLAAEVHMKLAAAEAYLHEFEGDAEALTRAQRHAEAAVALYRERGAHDLEAAARGALAAFDLTVP